MSDVLSPNGASGLGTPGVPPQRRSMLTAGLVVAGLHAAVIAAILLNRDPKPVVAAPRVVTAVLIAPEPVPVPVAQPEPPKPIQKPVVKPPPKPVVHKPTPHTTPKPTTVAAAPPEPPPPAPATPAPPAPTPPAPAAAPAPAIDPNVPKNVQHLTCDNTEPVYPTLSQRRGETGTVVIQFIVDTGGRVESAKVKKSSGVDRLDEAARQAALSTRCQPYREGGVAEKVITERPYSFNLTN